MMNSIYGDVVNFSQLSFLWEYNRKEVDDTLYYDLRYYMENSIGDIMDPILSIAYYLIK